MAPDELAVQDASDIFDLESSSDSEDDEGSGEEGNGVEGALGWTVACRLLSRGGSAAFPRYFH